MRYLLVVCTLLTLAIAQTSPTVNVPMVKSLQDLHVQSLLLQQRIEIVQEKIAKLKNICDKAAEMEERISQVNELLGHAQNAVLPITLFPYIGTPASNLKSLLSKTKKSLRKAQSVIAKVNQVLKPLKTTLDILQPVAEKCHSANAQMINFSGDSYAVFQLEHLCVAAMANSKAKLNLQKANRKFSQKTTPSIESVRKQWLKINAAWNNLQNKLLDIESPLAKIAKVHANILKVNIEVQKVLGPLKKALKQVNKIMDTKIKVKVAGVGYSKTVKKLLKSLSSLKSAVKKAFAKALKPFKKKLDKLLPSLKLPIDFDLPQLNFPALNTTSIDFSVQINQWMHELKRILQFSPLCDCSKYVKNSTPQIMKNNLYAYIVNATKNPNPKNIARVKNELRLNDATDIVHVVAAIAKQ